MAMAGRPDFDCPLDPDKLKQKLSAESREELSHEYNDIPTFMAAIGDMPQGAKEKCRYVNVLPTKKTRVPVSKVPGDDASDFINANYVSGFDGPKRYIAAQGPKENTMFDFWRMIWEQEVECLVMTTGLVENNRKKCNRYWPEKGSMEFGFFQIDRIDAVQYPEWITTTLKLTNTQNNKSRIMKHFWYTTWPDHGVPSSAAPVIAFLRAVKRETINSKAPILVHCSAGIGRTGTFMAIDTGMQQLQCDWRVCDISGTVKKMRKERGGSVQTYIQYRFIHQALLEYVTPGLPHSMFADNIERNVTVAKTEKLRYFGFTCRGSKPVFFNIVDKNHPADLAGIRVGDHILKINNVDVSRFSHKQVVEQIQKSGDSVTLTVVSKVDY
eukprot:m.155612 g.155612  ORF g.155612 m.155612 type:complete len:383 (+) comp30944_c1_seq1:53-1201(+)